MAADATMAELVDALDSGSSRRKPVDVRVILVANSELGPPPIVQKESKLIAVDGGLRHCLTLKRSPNLIVGDLDSAATETLALFPAVPIHPFPRDKDFSDLELALQICDEPAVVYGGLGGETDHLLANLHLLKRYPFELRKGEERVFALRGACEVSCPKGATLSLLPLEPALGVTTRGLKWELNGARLDSSFYSLSNIALEGHFSVEIGKGWLICFLRGTSEPSS